MRDWRRCCLQSRCCLRRTACPRRFWRARTATLGKPRPPPAPWRERAGLAGWDFAFQSQGLTDDKWLGPTVESMIDSYQQRGVRELVLAPIGFVCDHVEILYDVDILFRRYAEQRGIRLRRPESLNDSPAFIDALAAVVREKLEAA